MSTSVPPFTEQASRPGPGLAANSRVKRTLHRSPDWARAAHTKGSAKHGQEEAGRFRQPLFLGRLHACASQTFRPSQRRSAGFPTCRFADFQSADRPKVPHRVPSILGHFRCVSKLSTCATERRKPCNLSAHLRLFGLASVVAQVFQPAVSPTFSRQTVQRLPTVFLPSLATFGASASYQPALRKGENHAT